MFVAALCAAGLMPLIIRLRALDKDHFTAPQNVHNEPTSRLGGSAVFAAYVLGIVVAMALGHPSRRLLTLMVVSALPVLLAGVFEDVTRRLAPRQRLFAALLSAILASWLAGGAIARLDVPYIDSWLEILIFVLPLTWFMVAGACNAINLIDGAHGLAGGTALLMFLGMAVAASKLGDAVVLLQAVTMIGAIAGFMVWNYPRGKVFLGDGGAYFIGFIYSQLAIQIVARNDGLSAWFVIMLAAYPIMETLYSMYRRKLIHRTPSMRPDALHLHSLIYRRECRAAGFGPDDLAADSINARVAPRLWLHGALCCGVALAFSSNTAALVSGIAGYALFYCWQYAALLRGPDADAHIALVTVVLKDQRDGH